MTYHKARRAREDLQDYRNQAYIASSLDETSFDLQNTGNDNSFLYNNGALDALDIMPAGSMRSINECYYDMTVCTRGVSLEGQRYIDAEIEELIREIG